MIEASLKMMSDNIVFLHFHLISVLNHSWPPSTMRAYVPQIRLAKEDYALRVYAARVIKMLFI